MASYIIKQGEDKKIVLSLKTQTGTTVDFTDVQNIVAVAYIAGQVAHTYRLGDMSSQKLEVDSTDPTKINIYAQRQHTRYWSTGTLMFNILVQFPDSSFPDQDLDTEYTVVAGLVRVGNLRDLNEIQTVAPTVKLYMDGLRPNGYYSNIEAGWTSRRGIFFTITKNSQFDVVNTVTIQRSIDNGLTWNNIYSINGAGFILGSPIKFPTDTWGAQTNVYPHVRVLGNFEMDKDLENQYIPRVLYRLSSVVNGELFISNEQIDLRQRFLVYAGWVDDNQLSIPNYFENWFQNGNSSFPENADTLLEDFSSRTFTLYYPLLTIPVYYYIAIPVNGFTTKTVFKVNDANGADIPMQPVQNWYEHGSDYPNQPNPAYYKVYRTVNTYTSDLIIYVA